MAGVACPICHSEAIRENVSKVENIWLAPRAVNYCTTCQLYYLASMPTEVELVSYYKNDYYQFPAFLDLIKRAFRRSRSISQYRYIQDAIRLSGGKVLEVGACDGMLLKQFKGQNKVTGLELSDKYRAQAKQRYGVELLDKKFDELEDQFDLLIMSHVLEHFPDISATMKQVTRLLRRGGFFFVEVPNSPRPDECTSRELTNYLHGAHTYNFTLTSIETLLHNHGFKIISIDRITYSVPESYSPGKRRRLGEVFMGGAVSLSYMLYIAIYVAKIVVYPSSGFRSISDRKEPHDGPGDMIRVVAYRDCGSVE